MISPILNAVIVAWIHTAAMQQGVDPHFAHAVAITESRPKGGGELEMRVGPMGKRGAFVAPMGIAKCFAKDADIYDWRINVLIGVAALRGKDKVKVLRRYNSTATPAYIHEVRRIERRLKEGR